ncbi:protein adenylyltransferase SelO [Pseudonocardia xishanensis]|uniref:Protein nucleotidyltransferase YdiU n=1 Tax=Pseudonocardia xishanensis TaxID=630995 RepID=A0ABP8RCV8_9PSEU
MSTAVGIALDDSYARALPELGVPWKAEAAPEARVLLVNRGLGIDPALVTPENLLGEGTAMAYAGHQFGNYSPRLGDGRALLLGELPDGRDLHLKGSGRTPFARGGDGKAPLGPMLREYVISEAMYALGIPTTRSLAVVATGEAVLRERGPEPGAVLARVAASHLRVGTFQYAAATGDVALLRRLADYAIARHHPTVDGYLGLYERVVEVQAALVARWMQVGFVHGVMNTDNTTISGETIDYGPCAFMDAYDPATVFSSIDRSGRYAYGNQPAVLQWNLARLGEALLPLIDSDQDTAVEKATEVVRGFTARYDHHLRAGWQAKLGLGAPPKELLDDLFTLLAERRLDLTTFLRDLAEHLRGGPAPVDDPWLARWTAEHPDPAVMDRANPVYIPRNHLVEEALTAAVAGDPAPFEQLVAVLSRPYEVRAGLERYARPGPTEGFVTFCGT